MIERTFQPQLWLPATPGYVIHTDENYIVECDRPVSTRRDPPLGVGVVLKTRVLALLRVIIALIRTCSASE